MHGLAACNSKATKSVNAVTPTPMGVGPIPKATGGYIYPFIQNLFKSKHFRLFKDVDIQTLTSGTIRPAGRSKYGA